MPPRLDAIDRRILRELMHDGRLTNVALAQRAGITPPPCLRRVRALEEAGYITGYHAVVDETMIGYPVRCSCRLRCIINQTAIYAPLRTFA